MYINNYLSLYELKNILKRIYVDFDLFDVYSYGATAGLFDRSCTGILIHSFLL